MWREVLSDWWFAIRWATATALVGTFFLWYFVFSRLQAITPTLE